MIEEGAIFDVAARVYGLPVASASTGDRIATADPDVLATAATLGIETVELPGQD